jgi:hypothetical protein
VVFFISSAGSDPEIRLRVQWTSNPESENVVPLFAPANLCYLGAPELLWVAEHCVWVPAKCPEMGGEIF